MRSPFVRAEQIRGLLKLVNEAREHTDLCGRREHLVRGFAELVGAPSVAVLVDADFGPGRRGLMVDAVASYMDSGLARLSGELIARGSRFNPGVDALMDRISPTGEMLTVLRREMLSDAEWYDTEFVADYQRACGLDDFVYSARMTDATTAHAVTVTRGRSDRRFSDDEANLVELFHEEYLRALLPHRPLRGNTPRLTPRERAVLDQLLSGASEKSAAAALGISPQTVHGYVKTIYSAFGVCSRAELLAHCLGSATE